MTFLRRALGRSSKERDTILTRPLAAQATIPLSVVDHGGQLGLDDLWDHAPYFQTFNADADPGGTVDTQAAIQAEIDAAKAAGGGIVFPGQPGGTFLIESGLTLPHGVSLWGHGAGTDAIGTKLLAGSSFPSATPMITLGEVGQAAFNTYIYNMFVDGDGNADIGVYSRVINELSGIYRCRILDCQTHGIWIDSTESAPVAQNYFIRDANVLLRTCPTGNSAIAMLLDGGAADLRGIDNVTLNGNGVTSGFDAATGLQLDGVHNSLFTRIHLEHFTDGILIGPNTACHGLHFAGVSGGASMTDMIHVSNVTANGSILFTALSKKASTNTLNDQVSGITVTDAHVPFYLLGEFRFATGGFRSVIEGWFDENAAASQTAAILQRWGTSSMSFLQTWIPNKEGSIIAVSVHSNQARTGGTLTVEPYVNGVATGLQAVLDGTNTTFHSSRQDKDVDTFAAGDAVTLRITTTAGWTPTTADIKCQIEVEI